MYVCIYVCTYSKSSKSALEDMSEEFFCEAVHKLEYGRYDDLTQDVLNLAINPLSEEQQEDITIEYESKFVVEIFYVW